MLRRLAVRADVPQSTWYAYHAGVHWALLVWAGRLTEHDVQNMLNSSDRPRAPLQQEVPVPFAQQADPALVAPPAAASDAQPIREDVWQWLMFSRDGGALMPAFSGIPHQL